MDDERQGQDRTAPDPGSDAFPFPPAPPPRSEHDASASEPKKLDVLFWAGVAAIAGLLLIIAAAIWRIRQYPYSG
jgi:hypothetical protein